MSTPVIEPDAAGIARAVATLRAGGLVAFPTETVYGLGADARSTAAVRSIFVAKERPHDNPLIVHVADARQLEDVAVDVPAAAFALARRFWPGALTLVLRRGPAIPAEVSRGLDTLAVRVPAHPVALALLQAFNGPIAAPSANRSGRPSPTQAAHVLADLDGRIDLILDGGGAALGIESTVLDLVGPRPLLLRRGAVTREALAEALGEVDVATSEDEASRRSPGLRHRHYAPRCRVTLAPAGAGLEVALALRDQHGPRDMIGLMVRGPAAPPPPGVLLRSLPEALEGYAGALFAALRELEGRDVAAIVVEEVPEEGLGAAIMDRLRRAAAG